jgi:hypothetical protein
MAELRDEFVPVDTQLRVKAYDFALDETRFHFKGGAGDTSAVERTREIVASADIILAFLKGGDSG